MTFSEFIFLGILCIIVHIIVIWGIIAIISETFKNGVHHVITNEQPDSEQVQNSNEQQEQVFD